jgi:hypothetical protein
MVEHPKCWHSAKSLRWNSDGFTEARKAVLPPRAKSRSQTQSDDQRQLRFELQSVQLNNKIETLELGFICDRRKGSRSVHVILIPFDGTFQSDQGVIPVLIQKNADQYDPSDLLQNWKNGAEYIFLESKDAVDELESFMKANEMDGAKSVHFVFANSPPEGPQTSNHIAINVSGFSNGFDAFQMACASSQ